MNSINSNFNNILIATRAQARGLEKLEDKSSYNRLMECTFESKSNFADAPPDAKALASMVAAVGRRLPDAQTRFHLYQQCFEATAQGALSTVGGPVALMAKVALEALPSCTPSSRTSMAEDLLAKMRDLSPKDSLARLHADVALTAGAFDESDRVSKEWAPRDVILLNGLSVIAQLGPEMESGPDTSKSESTKSRNQENLMATALAELNSISGPGAGAARGAIVGIAGAALRLDLPG